MYNVYKILKTSVRIMLLNFLELIYVTLTLYKQITNKMTKYYYKTREMCSYIYTKYAANWAILSLGTLPLPRPRPLPPRPRPPPRPPPPPRLRLAAACLSSMRFLKTWSQKRQPECSVFPPSRGVLFC